MFRATAPWVLKPTVNSTLFRSRKRLVAVDLQKNASKFSGIARMKPISACNPANSSIEDDRFAVGIFPNFSDSISLFGRSTKDCGFPSEACFRPLPLLPHALPNPLQILRAPLSHLQRHKLRHIIAVQPLHFTLQLFQSPRR